MTSPITPTNRTTPTSMPIGIQYIMVYISGLPIIPGPPIIAILLCSPLESTTHFIDKCRYQLEHPCSLHHSVDVSRRSSARRSFLRPLEPTSQPVLLEQH